MRANQCDIIEVNFPLGNGIYKPHPAVVISNRDVYDAEGYYIVVMLSTKKYNEEFIFTITSDMLTKSTANISYAKCQLLTQFTDAEIIGRHGSIKKEYFNQLIRKINQSVFSFDCR